MVPVIEVHPSPYVVGGQQPMVLRKERHFAVRRGCTATHGFYEGAVYRGGTATSGCYHGTVSRVTPECVVGAREKVSVCRERERVCVCVCVCVWLERESSADLAEITEKLAFSPSSFTKKRKDKLFPQFRQI